ncbi:hypothetical protein GOODEAATRI_034381, partial [Goodea atripinnis]
SGPAELGGSQWPVCPAASNTAGLHIYGLYMYNNYFSIGSVHSHLHAALCRPEDCQSVQHGPDVWLHDLSLMCPSYIVLFQLLEDNIVTFVKNELKKIQKVLSPDYPEGLESQWEDEEVLEGEDEEKRRSSREAFVKITLNFLKKMKQEELAERLQSSKRISLQI